MPHLSFIPQGITGTTQGVGASLPGAGDADAARVEKLLSGLSSLIEQPAAAESGELDVEEFIASLPRAQPPKRIGKGRRRAALILLGFADAMRARSGAGSKQTVGKFLARERGLTEQQLKTEAEERRFFNQIRVRDFERKRAALADVQDPPDLDTTTETVAGTQRLVDLGIIPPTAVNQPVRLRTSTDPATGKIINQQFIGVAGRVDEPTIKTFNGLVTKEDIKNDPRLDGQEGERWIFSAVVGSDGVFNNVTPIRPIGETFQILETQAGLTRVGKTTGRAEPVVDEEGEQLRSFDATLKEMQFRQKRRVALLGKDLTPGIQTKIADSSAGMEAVAWAMRRYRELGGPQLVIGNQWVTSEESKQARAAIARAVIPIRRWLFGAALTESEKGSANDIIVDLENATNPGKLEANLVEMANLMWTARRTTLETAQKAGSNVSNFGPELRRMIFRTPEELLFEAPSILGEEAIISAPTGDIVIPGVGRVVIDENGDLKIQEE